MPLVALLSSCALISHILSGLSLTRIRDQPSVPETSGSTTAPVVISSPSNDHPGGPAMPAISSVSTPPHRRHWHHYSPPDDNHDDHASSSVVAFATSLADWPLFPDDTRACQAFLCIRPQARRPLERRPHIVRAYMCGTRARFHGRGSIHHGGDRLVQVTFPPLPPPFFFKYLIRFLLYELSLPIPC